MASEGNVLMSLAGGSIGAVVLGVSFLLYKCLQGKKVLSKCCGAEISVQNEPEPQPKIIEITHTPPNSRAGTPQLKAQEEGRRVSVIQV